MVPGLDEPSDRVTTLTPRFSRNVFWAIIALGLVWPWLTMFAVDGYLGTRRLRNFFAIYTDTPVLYLLLFASQALWSASPFVAFALVARFVFTASGTEPAAARLPRTAGVLTAGAGMLVLLTVSEAVAWKEYFLSPSGSPGIALALGLPPLLTLAAGPVLYGLGWLAGNFMRGSRRRSLPCLLAVALVGMQASGCLSAPESRLRSAASNGHPGAVKLLLSEGADVNARDEYGQTALYHAAWKGHADTVKVLLAAGADVNARNTAGGTALMGAAWNGRAGIVEDLIARGADVNTKNSVGGTALMIAVVQGHAEVVNRLLAAGADVHAKNDQGMTALMVAVKIARRDIAELLVKAGARE